MQGDCLDRMKEIDDGSVDLILSDPPYGTTGCKWDSIIPLFHYSIIPLFHYSIRTNVETVKESY